MTRLEAKAHWRKQREGWIAWSERFRDLILAIEDPHLRYAAAAIVDSVAAGLGSVEIKRLTSTAVGAVGFIIDSDVDDAILASLERDGAEDPVQTLMDAGQWIRTTFAHSSLLEVAWAFGHLENAPGNRRDQFRWLEHHGVIYDVPTNRFVGVRYDGGIWKVP